ncbi:MAG: hypothetical protein GY765_35355, partial [bacterium]|nr:hypothetical protein [bacterium]
MPKHSNDPQLDQLLKNTMKDDLPESLAEEMQDRLFAFRRKMSDASNENASPVKRLLKYLAIGNIPRAVLAFASIFFVILGSLSHMSAPQNTLADSVSAMAAATFAMKQIKHSESMHCTVQVIEGANAPLNYSIKWKTPNQTVVKATCLPKNINKSLWIAGNNTVTITNNANPPQNTIKTMDEWETGNKGIFLPISSLLSPTQLGNQLKGKWELKNFNSTKDKNP